MAKKRRRKKEEREKVKREYSAGGLVYKKDTFLIIQPAGTDRWQLPKGHIDKGESSENTAFREVLEETAIKAKVVEKIGESQYFFVLNGQKIFKKVTFYLMEYESKIDQEPNKIEIKEVKFVPYKKAFEMLTFQDDKNILQKGKELVNNGN